MSANDDHADNHGYFIGSLQPHQDEEHFSSSGGGRPLVGAVDAGRGFNPSVEYFNSGRIPATTSPWELELNWTRPDELVYPNNRSSNTSVDNPHLLPVNNLEDKYSFPNIQNVADHNQAANYNAVYGSLIRGSDNSYMNNDESWSRGVGSNDLLHASNSGAVTVRQGGCSTGNNLIIGMHQLAGWQGRSVSASGHNALCSQSWYVAAAPAESSRADISTGYEEQQQVRLGLDIHQSNQMMASYGGRGQHAAGGGPGEELYNVLKSARAEGMAGAQFDRPIYNLLRVPGVTGSAAGRPESVHVAMSKSKDRHSKVRTARGMRDRRVRLSVGTALQFYDIMDRLGLQQPSQAMDWLMLKAKDSIDDLPASGGPHHHHHHHNHNTIVAAAPAATPRSPNDDGNNNCIIALEPPPPPGPDHVDVAMPPPAPSPSSSSSSSSNSQSSS